MRASLRGVLWTESRGEQKRWTECRLPGIPWCCSLNEKLESLSSILDTDLLCDLGQVAYIFSLSESLAMGRNNKLQFTGSLGDLHEEKFLAQSRHSGNLCFWVCPSPASKEKVVPARLGGPAERIEILWLREHWWQERFPALNFCEAKCGPVQLSYELSSKWHGGTRSAGEEEGWCWKPWSLMEREQS